MTSNLQDPIWSIHHLAAALGVSVDTAREHTYRSDFPAPKAPFSNNLWSREGVLAWFAQLPDRPRPAARTRTARQPAAQVGSTPAKPKIKAYRARGVR